MSLPDMLSALEANLSRLTNWERGLLCSVRWAISHGYLVAEAEEYAIRELYRRVCE